jgi:hypothetical protein
MTIKARVTAGRLVVDEPTDLPDGVEVELLPLDPGDWLEDADREALHEALRQSDVDVAAGRLVDASEETPRKADHHEGPASEAGQQQRQPYEICKTSIPGSNPGGAAKIL